MYLAEIEMDEIPVQHKTEAVHLRMKIARGVVGGTRVDLGFAGRIVAAKHPSGSRGFGRIELDLFPASGFEMALAENSDEFG